MTAATAMNAALAAGHCERLMQFAHEVSFEAGVRLFEEGRHADRFWIVRTGTVAMDLRVPDRRAAVRVGLVVADRLHASRIRLLDLYAPHGSGGLE
ncbi:hypothetical protein ACWFR5_19440 [Streptomyces sp. NPDC055092]